jgi:single-strand DNA-binding protein
VYQNTIVVGHLGRDPEMRYLPSGNPVTSFNIATTRKWTNAEGQPQEKTTWFRVSVFGKQAEPCNQYLAKGSLVLVEGDIDVSTWNDKTTNEPRAKLELRARSVKFLSGKGEKPEAAAEPGAAAPAAAPETEDELPF